MAVQILKNAYLSVNAVVLSTFVKSITLNYEADVVETTAMSKNSKTRLSGLKDWSVDVGFNQDFAAAAVDVTLFSLVGGASVAVEVRPDAGAVSATNPKYTGNALVTPYPPITGSVGDLAMTTVKLVGDGDLTRATA